MPTPAAYALVASVKMPLGTTAFTLQCILDAALTVFQQVYSCQPGFKQVCMYSHDHIYTCLEVILPVHKDQKPKLVVRHDRAVLQVHSDIFSMGSAISEAYLNLKHNAMPLFRDSDPSNFAHLFCVG